MPEYRGAGLFYTTEVTRTDLGEHGGRVLRGRAERRVLRIALGARRGVRLTGGSLRPVAVEVTGTDANRYDVQIPATPDPRLTMLRRVGVCWAIAAAAVGIVGLLRARASS